jgi:hypothetical protein
VVDQIGQLGELGRWLDQQTHIVFVLHNGNVLDLPTN